MHTVVLRNWSLRHIGNASEHFVEGRVVVYGSSLGVRFLQEPELFESNDGVASGDF